MKYVYIPRNSKNLINTTRTNNMNYHCDANDYFKDKRKDDLVEIVNEINRREEEKFHLPKI